MTPRCHLSTGHIHEIAANGPAFGAISHSRSVFARSRQKVRRKSRNGPKERPRSEISSEIGSEKGRRRRCRQGPDASRRRLTRPAQAPAGSPAGPGTRRLPAGPGTPPAHPAGPGTRRLTPPARHRRLARGHANSRLQALIKVREVRLGGTGSTLGCMSYTRWKRARYAVPAAVLAAVGLGAFVPTLSGASAPPNLPAQTAQQLVAAMATAKTPQLSGALTWTSNLGLSDLSSLEGATGQGAGNGFDPLTLLSGNYHLNVWLGTKAEHVALIEPSDQEVDVVRNGNQLGCGTARRKMPSTSSAPSPPPGQMAVRASAPAVG